MARKERWQHTEWPDEARASKQTFARALAFSWLVLNSDAHVKNFAVLH